MSSSWFPATQSRQCGSAVFVIVLLALAVFQKAFWFAPVGDDLRILSSVSQTANPLSYFTSDWGMQGTYRLANGSIDTTRRSYRPMHTVSIWLGYRVFGVSAFPNQFINLALHVTNCLLLYGIIRRVCPALFPGFLLVLLSLISLYTVSPAIWVSDRATLMVALSMLLLSRHLIDSRGERVTVLNPWIVTGLTIVALSFQEGGLLLPLVAGAFVLFPGYQGPRWRHLALCGGLVCGYLGLRVLLFGPNAFAYASEGYVFGTRPYVVLSDLPRNVAIWARFENVAKDFTGVFVPVFDGMGRVFSPKELLSSSAWWLPTLVLAITATRRPITRVQWLALAVIGMNAALHVQVFRYRVEYISQLAFCLYVADSRIWKGAEKSEKGWFARERLAELCCAVISLVSVSQVNHYVQSNWVMRQDEVVNQHLAATVAKYPIAPEIVQKVLAHYAHGAQ